MTADAMSHTCVTHSDATATVGDLASKGLVDVWVLVGQIPASSLPLPLEGSSGGASTSAMSAPLPISAACEPRCCLSSGSKA